jgi:hypothetical protein
MRGEGVRDRGTLRAEGLVVVCVVPFNSRRLHGHHCHRGDDVNEILAVTDGVVEAVRYAGWYASAAFAGARSMLAERGMRRLEADGESVQREHMFLKTTATSMRTMTTARISST